MNRKELSSIIAKKRGITKKEAHSIVCDIFREITSSLEKKQTVSICRFGSFRVKRIAGCEGKKTPSGLVVNTPDYNAVKFRQAATLKSIVNSSE